MPTNEKGMKPFLPSSKPSGPLFIALNVLRAVSIIALLLVLAANIKVMVSDIKVIRDPVADGRNECEYYEYSSVPDQTGGPFWSILNRIFILFECLLLIMSEIGVPKCLFNEFIPMLGSAYGLGCLGVFQALVGVQVLSHYCDSFPQISNWILFIVGCFNILSGIFLRKDAKKKRQIFSWENVSSLTPQTRIAATAWDMVSETSKRSDKSMETPPRRNGHSQHDTSLPESPLLPSGTKPGVRFGGFGFGRQGEKAAAERGWKISRPLEVLPRELPSRT
nr:hypothetical protein L203_04205 [Cryptococcus depauperatus CBS 7841]